MTGAVDDVAAVPTTAKGTPSGFAVLLAITVVTACPTAARTPKGA